MSKLTFGSSVTLKQFADAVITVGKEVTIIGQGEMGIGKSSVLKTIAKQLPEYNTAYIDCTLLDLGDFALPYTEEVRNESTSNAKFKVTKFAPNARFKMHEGKPVIVMLDEIGKAMKSVKNVLLTLMLEHRIGDHKLPEGSIVFGTTNLMSEGVGDLMEAHARNRVCFITIAKSDADEWIENYAIPQGLDPTVIAWVKQFPHCLAQVTDTAQRDNPYINIPTRAGQTAFVTPRSLEKASIVAGKRHVLGDNVTISMLSGIIGESAARDMQSFFTVADKLPTWQAIIKAPDTTALPKDTVAKCILVFSAISRVGADTLPMWMQYVKRMDMEWQALFAKALVSSNTKQAIAFSSPEFKSWALANQWLF